MKKQIIFYMIFMILFVHELIAEEMDLGEKMFRSGDLKGARSFYEKVLSTDSQNAIAQYFLGLIEYEEGNIDRAKLRFQIAYECLKPKDQAKPLTNIPDERKIILEFPDNYEAKIYYKDGWYLSPKTSLDRSVSLDAGSTYKVKLNPKSKEPLLNKGMVGFAIFLSFLLAR